MKTILFLLLSAASVLAQARIVNTTASRPVTEAATVSLFRANAVTFRVKLDSTRPTLTGVTKLTAEIRASKLDTDPPLAATDIDAPTGAGPFDIEMTAGQMNQSLNGAASGVFWLVIYTIAPDDVLDVLYTAPLKLMEHGASLTAPAPPNTAIALTRTAADALYTTLATTTALAVRVTDLEAGTGTDTVLGDSDGVGLSDSSDLWISDGTPAGAVDLTPYALTASVAAGYQPLDSDLTSLAALTSTTFGRGLITTVDAAGLRTAAGLGTLATQSGTFSGISSGTNTGDQDLSGYALTSSLGTLATQSGTFSGTSSGTNTGDQDLSGYLPTASAATTYVPVTRTINGTALSGNITITAAAGTLTGSTLNATVTASSLTSVGVLAGLTSSAAIDARNGATAVPIYTHNTWTDASNYERGVFGFTSNILKIGTENLGTGTARAIDVVTGGAVRLGIDSGGFRITTPGTGAIGLGGAFTGPAGAYFNLNNYHGLQCASVGAGGGLDVGVKWSSGTNPQSPHVLGITREATTHALQVNSGTPGTLRDIRARSVIQQPPASVTPANNGDMVFEATSNTSVTLKMKGTDGTVRSVVLTLAP